MFSSIIIFACRYQPPTRRVGYLQQSEGSYLSYRSSKSTRPAYRSPDTITHVWDVG
jgi:hypothetical protein